MGLERDYASVVWCDICYFSTEQRSLFLFSCLSAACVFLTLMTCSVLKEDPLLPSVLAGKESLLLAGLAFALVLSSNRGGATATFTRETRRHTNIHLLKHTHI